MRLILAAVLTMLVVPLVIGGVGIGTTGGIKNSVNKLDTKVEAQQQQQQQQQKASQTPTVPTNFGALTVSSSQINLSWSPSTVNAGVVTNYNIYRNSSITPVATSTSAAYSDTGLTASTAYSYKVSACSSAGYCSAQPTPISVTTPKWVFTTGGSINSSPAIGTDGTIYVGSDDNNLYAIPSTGTIKWKLTTGGQINSSPAIGADGTIYVGSDDNNLYAIPSTGTVKWKIGIGTMHSCPAIGTNGTIYAAGYDFFAINPNGTQKWVFPRVAANTLFSSPAIGADGTIYVSQANNLYAITDNGASYTQKWVFATGGPLSSSQAIGADGTIYVGNQTDTNNLYAVNPNGTQKWAVAAGGVVSSPAIGPDGTIYLYAAVGTIDAINPDGTTKWVFSTNYGGYSSPAIGADGTIYVGSNYVLALNPDGTQKWASARGWGNSPAIGPDGTVYAGGAGNSIYAIYGNTPLASSAWPKFQHDMLNSGLY